MSNDESKLTVFISSMIGLLWDERAAVEEAIRTGIQLAHTWVFERAPASSEAIVESYLARVRECDVYLLILGDDVSDPVKAEYRTAVECTKPRLCFVQEGVERTEALKEFLPTLQADVKYATFTDEESLRREVLRAVRQELVEGYKRYRLDEAERAQIVASAVPLPTPEELAAYRNAVADHYAKWDDPRYIQEEGEFLPLFASPYDEIEGPGRERTDLLDAIRSAQRIIVLGEPGTGKTTALERLMLEYARQGEGPLPVFVPLLYYTGDLMESIRTELNRHAAFHLPDEAYTRAFLQGVPCVLMFDGLNEVSGRLREKIAGEIRQVMGDYPRQRYAVTSRSQDELWQSLRGEDEDISVVVIREISDEQVRDYLCGHLGAEAGQALYDRLDERMRGLAHNPLLLWMIKEARTDEAGALPDNRGRLFDHFVTQMLKREVRLKEWAVSVPAEVKRECLAELAYEMFTSERESRLFVASPQAEAVLAVYLEGRPGARYEVRQVLEESKRNGLLVGEENVRFMHQSVQEFFAACRLRQQAAAEQAWGLWERGLRGVQAALSRYRRLAALSRDDWWAETFILLAGMADDPSWLVGEVARENAWLAYWCLLEGQEVDEGARLAVEQATTEALASPRRAVRLRAVQALSRMANPRTVEPLITALGDEDEAVARVAQRALVRMEETVTPKHLEAVISRPEIHLSARMRVGNRLGQIGDPRFYGPCLEPALITVPGGEFWMASETKAAYDREKPAHKVHVAQFQMAKYPVTNAQFKGFVDAGGYSEERYWTRAGWAWRQGKGEQFGREHHEWPKGWEDGQFPPERANHPVVNVTWYEAVAYTRWLAEATGKPYRLPTEAEWEKAARGDQDRREYPWGDKFDSKKVNMSIGAEIVGGTSPVGIYPAGASPYGILDLSGNVWEWCSSLYQDYPYDPDDGREDLEAEGDRVLRGGSWINSFKTLARCSCRLADLPSRFQRSFGLRLVVGFAHSLSEF